MIRFTRIIKEHIFFDGFDPFTKNNTIEFSGKNEIAVLYGPNGTGKTSLVSVLQGADNTSLAFIYKKSSYIDPKKTFHIINDQNSRNIIAGNIDEFFLGDNIRDEFQLKEQIDKSFSSLAKEIAATLKSAFEISTVGNPLLTLIQDTEISRLITSFVNTKKKGEDIRSLENLEKLSIFPSGEIVLTVEQQAKLDFLVHDYIQKNDSIIQSVERLTHKTLQANTKVHQIEENTEAIKILERFQKSQCIVCDSQILWQELLAAKTTNKMQILANIEEKQRTLLEKVIELVPTDDPFLIKTILLTVLSSGDPTDLIALKVGFDKSKKLFEFILLQKVSSILNDSDLLMKMREYEILRKGKLEIESADLSYIESIVNHCMDKHIKLTRDTEKNIVITLESKPFLGMERRDLPLSTGEQNFLSLSFEFLKARNSAPSIVVIDDPVSSFDSIYKNKVVYAMVKMLENKKRLILTHNTDLLRLFEAQHRGCYRLYLLNNTLGGENGFIPVNKDEQNLLINLCELVDVFRSTIFPCILDQKLFLVSMIPFLRGYASITHKKKWYCILTSLMHGGMTQKVDVSKAYRRVFEINKHLPFSPIEISVPEILALPLDNIHILDCSKYPLLDKTLRHSLTYLYLRLQVEKKLIDTFQLDGRFDQLGTLIDKAFPKNNTCFMDQRVLLTSKKTLINEFNHFEGNLSIFQPAIDISDQVLEREKNEILNFVRDFHI